jgi:hypothetical protein
MAVFILVFRLWQPFLFILTNGHAGGNGEQR